MLLDFPSSLSCINFSIFKSDYNTIWVIGNNSYSKLGFNKDENLIFPLKELKHFHNVSSVSCGELFTILCTIDGLVYSFGCNMLGQLGINVISSILSSTHIPQQVKLPFTIDISCGAEFSLCLTKNKEIWSFGANNYGQLGLGHKNVSISPQHISTINNISYIVTGCYHCICKSNNDWYIWGFNYNGELGNESNISLCSPIKYNWPFSNNIKSIKAGKEYTLFLTVLGHVYSCGRNNYGQLGHGDNISINIPKLIKDIPEIHKIECGYFHSLFIDIDKNLWVFGNNEYGQLGLGDTNHRNKPILNTYVSNITDISHGGLHTFIKTINNKIYSFGDNTYNQQTIKSQDNIIKQLIPIQILINKEDIWNTHKSTAKSARK